MITIEITETTQAVVDSSLLWGCSVDFPKSSSALEVYSLEIIGWVLGKRAPLTQVRVENADKVVLAKAGTFIERPDVAQAFPDMADIGNCGFRMMVSMIGIQGAFELCILAEFTDGSEVVIGRIHGKRSSLDAGHHSVIQPLMITTLGRTGSTWLTYLLGMHQQIVTYRPFQFEPRISTYWAQILLTLGSPASYMQMLAADLSDDFWWLGTRPLPFDLSLADPELLHEMGAVSIRELASLCRGRIEAFYGQVAQIQGKNEARYFGEKLSPDLTPCVLWDLYPAAREIILVRDFRDMLCSIIAYNARLGFTGFGTSGFASQSHYVWKLRTDVLKLLHAWRGRGSRVHLVRYEDLIRSPAETLAGMCHYLGVDHPGMDLAAVLQNASGEIGESHRTSADATQSMGRWRTELDAPLQAVCREALGDLLSEFGYPME